MAAAAGLWSRPAASFLLLFFSVILMAVSGAHSPVVEQMRMRATDMLTPLLVQAATPVHGAAAFVRDVSGLAALQSEIAALRDENARLREWYNRAVYLENENSSLRGLLQVTPDAPHEFVSARVISDAGNAYVKTLLVAAGSDDGVEKGQAVLSGEGLVGRILEVGRKSARILLITDINSRVPVIIQGSDAHAVLAGTNDDRPVLKHLPMGYKALEGAVVMTSGHGGIFPAGLPLGKIKAVPGKTSVGGPVFVDPLSDFTALSYVKIVNSKIDPNLKTGVLNP
ncbi:MAG: rod shape-determining protein MreC [Alphaproteobacteria bacterium]|nr:rod shape-determining protein MreC [Alphaproteobacteria bacterium]MCD8525898.1 rod shape-determining protein MreC [Alphaproteobacteria bacterium]MCD8570018.1 rod shape-determining protein MreC [Alphaproteobacteria bacterium]